MKHLSVFLALASFATPVGIFAKEPDLVDSSARPLIDSAGVKLNYAKPAPTATQPRGAKPMRAIRNVASVSAAPGDLPEWQHTIYGSGIGEAGMEFLTLNGQREVYVTGSIGGGYGANDFWQILQPEGNGYRQVWAHPPYQSALISLSLANVVGDSAPEVVIGLESGEIEFYDPATRTRVGGFAVSAGINALRAADLTGDGTAEIIALTDEGLRVFDSSGTLLWSVAGPGGSDLVVAQMDADPALEIATTSGHIVDAASHAIQWTRAGGFGASLRALDFDQDGHAELIAATQWNGISAYDVDLQSEKWRISTSHDIGAIEVANVDADPEVELIYGDGQWGSIHVLNAATRTEKWSVGNPEHGVTRIGLADVDGNGIKELHWGAGHTSSGSDYLFVANTQTHQITWQSEHLDGPFVPPVIGDIDGDGSLELVTACQSSESGYDSGRILVFDLATLTLRAISVPIVGNRSWTGLNDLRLRNVDGDAALEIIVAADQLYDGVIEIYDFSPQGAFTLKWTNTIRPSGMPYSQVQAVDLNGDGNPEIIAGNDRAHTGSTGVFIKIIDYATQAVTWQSPHLGGTWSGISTIEVADFDGDGRLEFLAVSRGSGVFVFDAITHTQKLALMGDYECAAARVGDTGFYVGRTSGTVQRFAPTVGGGYAAASSWAASTGPIKGLTCTDSATVWVSADGVLSLWDGSYYPLWASVAVGSQTRVAVQPGAPPRVFTATSYGIAAFDVEDRTALPAVSLTAAGSLLEGSATTAQIVIALEPAQPGPLTVEFTLTGSAVPEADYRITGATSIGSGNWSVTIPAGATSFTITLSAIQDRTAESSEEIEAILSPTDSYRIGASAHGSIALDDDEPFVSVYAEDDTASEYRIGRNSDLGTFTFSRTGNLSKRLAVRFALEGTAERGSDYRSPTSVVIFPPGRNTVSLKIHPIADRVAESDEVVVLRLLPHARYLIDSESESPAITILDGAPELSLGSVAIVPNSTIEVQVTRNTTNGFRPTAQLLITRESSSGEIAYIISRAQFKIDSTSATVSVSNLTDGEVVTIELLDDSGYRLGETLETSLTFRTPVAP